MGKIELETPIIKGLNSSDAVVTGVSRPPVEVAGEAISTLLKSLLECPSIYPYSFIYISRLGLLALPVFKVGGLAYVYSFGNA